MADYCSCGSAANFRCRCGAFLCDRHVLCTPGPAVRVPPESLSLPQWDSTAIRRQLADCWTDRASVCADCHGTILDGVATRFAEVFRSHTDGTPETAARILLLANSWAARMQWSGTSLGQRTLGAMGHSPEWAHTKAMDTAVRLRIATGPGPVTVPIGRVIYKKTFWGNDKYLFDQLGSVEGWLIPYTYNGDGGPRRAAVLIGARGAFSTVTPARNVAGAVEVNSGQADVDSLAAKTIGDPTPSPWFGSYEEEAIAALVS